MLFQDAPFLVICYIALKNFTAMIKTCRVDFCTRGLTRDKEEYFIT